MADRSGKAFVIAVVLHLLLFALLFTGYLLSPEEEPPDTEPFELYDPPSTAAEEASVEPAEPAQPQIRQMELPDFDSPDVELPPTEPRERPRPEPRPEPEPAREPEPEPAPEPEPRREEPAPEPEPQPERMTAAEFRAIHGAPREPQPRPQPAAPTRRVEAPRIDTSNIRESLQTVVSSERDSELVSRLSNSDQRELERYFARLRAAIERSWNRPSGATQGMTATVRFSISSEGRITNARIADTSGSGEFDRSIVAAFERLASFDPPPDGESYTPKLTFRVD